MRNASSPFGLASDAGIRRASSLYIPKTMLIFVGVLIESMFAWARATLSSRRASVVSAASHAASATMPCSLLVRYAIWDAKRLFLTRKSRVYA